VQHELDSRVNPQKSKQFVALQQNFQKAWHLAAAATEGS
jgi:hypothetical protein